MGLGFFDDTSTGCFCFSVSDYGRFIFLCVCFGQGMYLRVSK